MCYKFKSLLVSQVVTEDNGTILMKTKPLNLKLGKEDTVISASKSTKFQLAVAPGTLEATEASLKKTQLNADIFKMRACN